MGNASVNESEASGDELLASLYRDRRVLESLTADFTAVYIIDLDTGMAEVMKVGQDTNASVLLGGSATARVDWADVAARYIQSFIPPPEGARGADLRGLARKPRRRRCGRGAHDLPLRGLPEQGGP